MLYNQEELAALSYYRPGVCSNRSVHAVGDFTRITVERQGTDTAREIITTMTSVRIPQTDDALLAECDVDTFRSSGPGGQHVNRRETAVRLRHRPTGLMVVSQQERSQYRNKRIALANLRRRLENLNRRRRPRVRTAVPRRVRERILASKKRRALTKRLRKPPSGDE